MKLSDLGRDQLEDLCEKLRQENVTMLDNLTATQTRCTTLIDELRALKRAPDVMVEILGSIVIERERQEKLCKAGRFKSTCADLDMNMADKLAVLAEEFGEVARQVTEERTCGAPHAPRELMTELVQVASVCVAWCEALHVELHPG